MEIQVNVKKNLRYTHPLSLSGSKRFGGVYRVALKKLGFPSESYLPNTYQQIDIFYDCWRNWGVYTLADLVNSKNVLMNASNIWCIDIWQGERLVDYHIAFAFIDESDAVAFQLRQPKAVPYKKC